METKLWLSVSLAHPRFLLLPLLEHGFFDKMEDEGFLKLSYRVITGKKLNLDNPESFNEKIQWLKLHDRNPLYHKLVDKFAVRDFVGYEAGKDMLVPFLGVWEKAEDIDFDALPNSFVLKCTHGHGDMVLVKDKTVLNRTVAIEKLNKCLGQSYFERAREWAYKDVPPRIIAEEFLDDGGGFRPADYKYMCFNGKAKLVCVSRSLGDEKGCVSFYDEQGSRMNFKRKDYPECPPEQNLPECHEMLHETAEKLAEKIGSPFVRVDFYVIGGKPYFSEFTFYPCGGTMFLEPEKWEKRLGKWLKIGGERT